MNKKINNVSQPIPTIAWAVAGLLFLATVLNYMDRQTLSMGGAPGAKGTAARQRKIRPFGVRFLFHLRRNASRDRLDPGSGEHPVGIRCFCARRSTAGALTGASSNFAQLFGCRLLLGVGEAANRPAALRVVSKILPPEKRSFGNGLFNSGASVGAVITPPLMVYLSMQSGWRFGFVVIGILGFFWVIGWLVITRWMPSIEERNAPTQVAAPVASR